MKPIARDPGRSNTSSGRAHEAPTKESGIPLVAKIMLKAEKHTKPGYGAVKFNTITDNLAKKIDFERVPD